MIKNETLCEHFANMNEPGFAILQNASYVNSRWLPYDEYIKIFQKVRCSPLEMVYAAPFNLLRKSSGGGTPPNKLLDEIFVQINLETPDDYTGDPLKTGDVIVLKERNKFISFFFDSKGYKLLDDDFFSRFRENDKKRIIVALIDPREEPEFIRIEPGYEMFRTIDISSFEIKGYSGHYPLVIIMSSNNDYLDFNRNIGGKDVYGRCIVVRREGSEFRTLGHDDIEFIKRDLQVPTLTEQIETRIKHR